MTLLATPTSVLRASVHLLFMYFMLLSSSSVARAWKLSALVTRNHRAANVAFSASRHFASSSTNNNNNPPDPSKRYLQVPFDQKEEVKALGARWDKDAKKWFVPESAFTEEFARWLPKYLNVPFASRNDAKAMGAMWDPVAQKWYIPANIVDITPFAKWMDKNSSRVSPAAAKGQANSDQSKGNNNAAPKVEYPPRNQAIVILDLDTNGLPQQTKGKYSEFTDLISYDTSRIVQLSYALCNTTTFEKLEGGTFIIKSDGFTIDNQQFHGISLPRSLKEGVPFKEAASVVMSAIDKADYIISHNAYFDMNIFKSELFRYGLFEMLKSIGNRKELCSMLMTTPLLGLLDKNGNPKHPSLKELVKFALNEDLPSPHNASIDVELVRRSLQKLVEANKFVIQDNMPEPRSKQS